MKLKDLEKLREKHDVIFVLVEKSANSETSKTFGHAAKSLFSRASYFQVNEVTNAAKMYSIPKTPSLICLKDDTTRIYEGSLESVDAIREWILKEQYPALVKLEDHNAREVLMGENMIVLGLLNPESDDFNNMKSRMKHFSQEYLKLKRGGKTFYRDSIKRDVIFAWLDAVKWSGYAEKAYGAPKSRLPKFVMVDAKESEYFEYDTNGLYIKMDMDEILETLDAIQHNELHVI